MLATLRRVAPVQTLPRGKSGPEAGDGRTRSLRHGCLHRQTEKANAPENILKSKRGKIVTHYRLGQRASGATLDHLTASRLNAYRKDDPLWNRWLIAKPKLLRRRSAATTFC